MSLPLSVLDLVPVASGASTAAAVANSLSLARLADRLGYTRYWYAEHHNMPIIASTTPALMIALAARETTRIHVGAGGVMLPNHSALQVAESYKLLEALYPGRIDLGIGRAPGTDPVTAYALRRSREAVEADDFPAQLAELLAWGKGALPEKHPFRSVRAFPLDVPLPPVWLLGSSGYSAQMAALLGKGFAFAAHFSPQSPEGPMLVYRDRFEAVSDFPQPHAILALSVVCAPTLEEAERLASSMRLVSVWLRTGHVSHLPTPEEALAYDYSPVELDVAESYRRLQIVGDPTSVKAQIEAIAARTRADEVMVTTVTHDPRARERSYQLLAEAFGLPRA